MANTNTHENEGIHKPVAAVSSTSSLDSFTATAPQHSSQTLTSHPSPQHSSQTLTPYPSSVTQLLHSAPSTTTQVISPSDSNINAVDSIQNMASLPSSVQVPQQLQSSASTTTRVVGPSDTIVHVANPLSIHNQLSVASPQLKASSDPPPLIPSKNLLATTGSDDVTASNGVQASTGVAEFLCQLSKMLTDDNREVIEWSNSRIEVHNPHRLASEVLHKYFRHSKFASFQRQLNYFGFRKLAGKGKMAPCSYINDAVSPDLRSILLIKRKTTPLTVREKSSKKRERSESGGDAGAAPTPQVNPVLADILQRSTSDTDEKSGNIARLATGKGIKHQIGGFLKSPVGIGVPVNNSHVALARSAVGKGIRHGYSSVVNVSQAAPTAMETNEKVSTIESSTPDFTFQDPHHLGMDVQSSLSELSHNFKNSMRNAPLDAQFFGMLSRDSSLIDLAMLDTVEPTPVSEMRGTTDSQFLSFVDFPHSSQEFDVPNLD